MKALIYKAPCRLAYEEAPPPADSGDILIRVDAAGICGSDMHAYLGHDERRPPPLILGHEAAGATADGGRRVALNPLVSCGVCAACAGGRANLCGGRQIISMPPRQGAFAEYVALPAANLISVPDGIGAEQAALCEPLACGWHAVRLAAEAAKMPAAEWRCLVIGGGAIGIGAALILRHRGCENIAVLEPNAARRQTLARAGDFDLYGEDGAVLDGGADVVIDAVGLAATRALACRACAAGGVIAHIGLGAGDGGMDARRLTLQEITFIGAYTYTPADFRAAAAAAFAGELGALDWLETRPLADGARAFADLRAGKVAAAKIILRP